MTERKNGRPPKYTEEQVLHGIKLVQEQGLEPNGDTVKRAMVDKLGVTGGINAQSLDQAVRRLLTEQVALENAKRLSALPSCARQASEVLLEELGNGVMLFLAKELEGLKSAANRRVADLQADLRNQRNRISELEDRLAAKDTEIAGLEDAIETERHLNSESALQCAKQQAQIQELEAHADLEKTMRALFTAAVAEASGGTPNV